MNLRHFRTISLAPVILLLPATYVWVRKQEMTYLNWALPAAGVLSIILLAHWYLIFGQAPWRRRLSLYGVAVLVFLGLAGAARLLLRYEGSSSGSSFPRFAWVWNASDQAVTSPLFTASPALDTPIKTIPSEWIGESPELLGPDRDGMWSELPFGTDWTQHMPQLLWRRPLGRAWSSFAVKNGLAITHEQIADDEVITALDLLNGQTRWQHRNPGVRLLLIKEENAGAAMGGDGPRATPVIFEGFVYTMGSTGRVHCLDLENGKERWSKDIIAEYKGEVQKWGMANSPLIVPSANLVVVAGSDEPGATLIALDLTTGAERWVYRTDGASYSSPRLIKILGIEQIVSINRLEVSSHDPASGERLWRYDWPGGFPKVGQPILIGADQLLLTASYGAGSPLIQLARAGNQWTVRESWKSNRLKTKFSSAVVRDGYAYGLDEGRLAAIDLGKGEKVWKNEKFGFGQQLLFDDHLLVQTETGAVVVGSIRPDGFVEKGRLEAMSSMTWNVPVVAGRILLVRNDREAACYLLPEPAPE